MRPPHLSLTCAVLLAVASAAGAQQPPPQPSSIRQLGGVAAKASQTFGPQVTVRALPGNRVLVNDMFGRRLILLDSSLTNATIVADSTSATANAYAGRIGGMIPYRADSTLFIDPTTLSMLVIDPAGKIARVMSVPRSQDAGMLSGPLAGGAGFDASGRMVYRSNPLRLMGPPGPGGAPQMPQPPDSAAIVRVDLATRQVDTVGMVKIPKISFNISQDDKGRITMTSEVNPLPVVDEWAVLSDGSVAFVRGRDYHVDWVGADGAKSSSPKIPFDWQRLTDDDKVAFIDSVKAARARLLAQQAQTQAAPTSASGPQVAGNGAAAPAGAARGGAQQQTGEVRIFMGGGGPDGGRGGGRGDVGINAANLQFISPSELPDYKPPFFANSVRADAEGNLWVRTIPTKAIPGGAVYDVINRKGELVERVQIPENRTIVGFGAGTVFMTMRDSTGTKLERARMK
jgi:hypothetical protein